MTINESDHERFRAMLTGGEDPGSLDIDVAASGGATTERYKLQLSVSGAGHISGHLFDELNARDFSFERDLLPSARAILLQRLQDAGLLEARSVDLPLPADSVVARIKVSVDGRPVQELIAPLDLETASRSSAQEAEPSDNVLRVLLDLMSE